MEAKYNGVILFWLRPNNYTSSEQAAKDFKEATKRAELEGREPRWRHILKQCKAIPGETAIYQLNTELEKMDIF